MSLKISLTDRLLAAFYTALSICVVLLFLVGSLAIARLMGVSLVYIVGLMLSFVLGIVAAIIVPPMWAMPEHNLPKLETIIGQLGDIYRVAIAILSHVKGLSAHVSELLANQRQLLQPKALDACDLGHSRHPDFDAENPGEMFIPQDLPLITFNAWPGYQGGTSNAAIRRLKRGEYIIVIRRGDEPPRYLKAWTESEHILSLTPEKAYRFSGHDLSTSEALTLAFWRYMGENMSAQVAIVPYVANEHIPSRP